MNQPFNPFQPPTETVGDFELPPSQTHFPASYGKRVMAIAIDTFVVGLLTKLVSAIDSNAALLWLVSISYFVGFQTYKGWTPGKKIFGLSIVNKDDGERPTLGRVLARETIGRLLSSMVLMVGYLLIFFDQDRQGFHDKIAKTMVVSETFEEEGSSTLLKVAFGGLASVVAVIGILVYVTLYTAVPLRHWASQMEAAGWKIDQIEGSLMTGVSIGSVQFANESVDLQAEAIKFHYTHPLQRLAQGEIKIDRIESARFHLKILKVKPERPSVKKTEEESSGPRLAKQSRGNEKFKIEIEKVDINDVMIAYLDQAPFKFERFYLTNAMIDNESAAIEKIWLSSPNLQFSLDKFDFKKGEQELVSVQDAQLVAKHTLFPEYLAGDIDLKTSFKIDLKNKSGEGRILGLRNSLSASIQGSQIELKARQIQPHWYFKNSPPLHDLNFEYQGPWIGLLLGTGLKGQYAIRSRVFQMKNSPIPGGFLNAEFGSGPQSLMASLKASSNWKTSLFQVQLNSAHASLEEALAQLYFSKGAEGLSPAEKQLIQMDSKFFAFQSNMLRSPASLGPPVFDNRSQNLGK